jgi:glutamate N-acetyltransferase/amino-acid N-acetyltransferase
MTQNIKFLTEGTVTTPKGFAAGATYAGTKTYGAEKLDLGLIYSAIPSAAAGVFTTNKVKSPSVVFDQKLLKGRLMRGVVVTSGIANTCVGPQGAEDAQEMADLAADQLGVSRGGILVGSTGIIGLELPMALIRAGIKQIEVSEDGGHAVARAIMTTDTRTKEAAVRVPIRNNVVHIGGIVKGAGMIHPDMATMLCFITTDAKVEISYLQKALNEAVNHSFNMLSIDGDTSTNDMVILLANGASGIESILENSEDADVFQEALTQLCIDLTKQLASDGEGASQLIEVTVDGAASQESARKAAKTVVASNLVKSAVHGGSPNWGRVLAALGRSGAEVYEEKIALFINGVCIMDSGMAIPFHRDAVASQMRKAQVSFHISLNVGDASATAWGCDLSEGYVTINSAYTT